jgi:hypothetical protein
LEELLSLEISAVKYTSEYIYLHINVPLASTTNMFSIWTTTILPVPFHTDAPSREGYTLLESQTAYLGISQDSRFFIELEATEFLLFSGSSGILYSKNLFTVRPLSPITCLSAIWLKDSAYAGLCKITAFPLAQALDYTPCTSSKTPLLSHLTPRSMTYNAKAEKHPSPHLVHTVFSTYHVDVSCRPKPSRSQPRFYTAQIQQSSQ